MINFNKQKNRGFTLVEMLVAIGLFTLITSISLGAILSIFDANRRSRSAKTVVDNLNLSLENITRTVRFGDRYHCGTSGSVTSAANCSNGDTALAIRFEGNTIIYQHCGNEIRRSETGQTNCDDMVAVTSSDTVVEYLRFYVFNATENPSLEQPYVVAVIKGYVGNKPTTQSKFSIQTLMSQRILDYNG